MPIFQLGDGSFPPLKTISNTNLPRRRARSSAETTSCSRCSRDSRTAPVCHAHRPRRHGQDPARASRRRPTLVPEYKAGVFWVGLATLRDPALVTETIAQTLGAKDGLAEHIGERETAAPARQPRASDRRRRPSCRALLAACPNLTLLVTSRELLRVQGEVEYAVPPLAEPEAVELFCERAPGSSRPTRSRSSARASTTCRSLSSWPPRGPRRSRPSRSSSGSPSGSTC